MLCFCKKFQNIDIKVDTGQISVILSYYNFYLNFI